MPVVLSSQDNKQWPYIFPSALGTSTVPSFEDDYEQCLVQVQMKREERQEDHLGKIQERWND